IIIAESSLHLGVSCQQLTAVKDEESSSEGSTVTLTCKYTKGSADYFFWYRQHPGKPPEFLISHLESGQISLNPVPGLSATVRKEETQMDLKISSAAVTDSAVYYCAVRPTVTGNTQTTSAGSFQCREAMTHSELPLDGLKLLSLSVRLSSAIMWRKLIFVACIRGINFFSVTTLTIMTTLPLHHDGPIHCPYYC
uniref:Ig-like domain-containing protein n=1 Tax=Stegastes partitus TaxID=144197 RepID=A0A3B5A5I8_9TELE